MKIETTYFWFRLFKTKGIGPKTLNHIAKLLKENNLAPQNIPLNKVELTSRYPELADMILAKIQEDDKEIIYKEYKELQARGIEIIYPGHVHYPTDISPYSASFGISPVLFCKGQTSLLCSSGIAIVGARNVSEEGQRFARQFAADLASAGMNVISGYAKGVDSNAHLGALHADGTTTLVLSSGINEFQIKKDFKDFDWNRDILVVSQFQPTTKWMASHAMMRNKLICALSKGIIVIEAGPEKDEHGKMSGTFDSGKTAIQMKLPLFVISPSCFNNPPKGNDDLIKLGGIAIRPEDGIDVIIRHISSPQTEKKHDNRVLVQNDLFYSHSVMSQKSA